MEQQTADYAAAVVSGHAGMTVALVQAVLASDSTLRLAGSAASAAVGLPLLRGRLQQEQTAAGRNRLVRDWLALQRDGVVAVWAQLGFPVAGGAPLTAHTFGQRPANGAAHEEAATAIAAAGDSSSGGGGMRTAGGTERVVVFDFDGTLTTEQVRAADVVDPARACLGGQERVAMLRQMLRALQALPAVTAVVLTVDTRSMASNVFGEC